MADFGEFDAKYIVPNTYNYDAYTWLSKGANTRTYSHKRNSKNLDKASSLVFAFYDKDNRYANVNLGQFNIAYYINEEDLELFGAWAAP